MNICNFSANIHHIQRFMSIDSYRFYYRIHWVFDMQVSERCFQKLMSYFIKPINFFLLPDAIYIGCFGSNTWIHLIFASIKFIHRKLSYRILTCQFIWINQKHVEQMETVLYQLEISCDLELGNANDIHWHWKIERKKETKTIEFRMISCVICAKKMFNSIGINSNLSISLDSVPRTPPNPEYTSNNYAIPIR